MIHKQLAILTATPDLLAQGLVQDLLTLLLTIDAVPIAACPYLFSAADSVMLYDGRVTHNRTERKVHSSWLGPRLFTAGPSLVLILRSDTGSEPFQEQIRAIKGSSRLGETKPGEIRSLSHMCDRSLSLVHSPDDHAGFLHEIDFYFGSQFLEYMNFNNEVALPSKLVSGLAPRNLDYRQTVFHALPLALEQILCLVACDPESGIEPKEVEEPLRHLADLNDKLFEKAGDVGSEPLLWSSLERISMVFSDIHRKVAANIKLHAPMRAYSRALASLKLCRVAKECTVPQTFDPSVSHCLVDALRNAGLSASQWDEQRLHVIAAYHTGRP